MSKFLFLILFALSAHAERGTGSSGGGDELAKEFVSLSNQMLGAYPFANDQKQVLVAALADSHIVSVPVLIDPVTSVPIPNQEKLVAWTTPGFIQIHQQHFSDLIDAHSPVAPYLFHELYRASGLVTADNRSPDDAFQISIGLLHLEKLALTDPGNLKFLSCGIQYRYVAADGSSGQKPLENSMTQLIYDPTTETDVTITTAIASYTLGLWQGPDHLPRLAIEEFTNLITGASTTLASFSVTTRFSEYLSQTKPFTTIDDQSVSMLALVCRPNY